MRTFLRPDPPPVSEVRVTYFCDPGCPWGYSASPVLARLRYRYGSQLRFRLVCVGLWETGEERAAIGYAPVGTAQGNRLLRRFGMPLSTAPRPRVLGSGRACKAVVAARLLQPEREHDVLRALQFAYFTTTLLVDTDEGIAEALAELPGLDAGAIVDALDAPEVEATYRADWRDARTAAGSPSEAIGRTHEREGVVRYTTPTLVFESEAGCLQVGGFQGFDAYETVLGHVGRGLERRWSAADPVEALERVGYPLTTYEVAACMAIPLLPVDTDPAEDALVAACAEGRVERRAVGEAVLWSLPGWRADAPAAPAALAAVAAG